MVVPIEVRVVGHSEAGARAGVPLSRSDARRAPVGVVRPGGLGNGFMAAAQERLTSGVAPKTLSGQKTALRAFKEYLLLEGLDLSAFGVSNMAELSILDQSIRSQTIFLGFAEYLVTARRVQVETAKQYVRNVRAQFKIRTGVDPSLGHPWGLLTTLYGRLKRDFPEKRTKRNPILQQHLLQFKARLDMSDTTCKMYWALSLLLFFGVSRKGDHLPESRVGFDPTTDTTRSDLQARDAEMYVVKIKQTKTRHKADLNFDGKPLVRSRGNPLCPVTAIEDYLAADPLDAGDDPSTTPLFRHTNGSAVSRDDIHQFVKVMTRTIGLRPEHFGGHSFRIGGATAALSCEAGDKFTVQVMGMWLGDSVSLYTRPTMTMIKGLLKQMMSNTETIVTESGD